jgi:hypothetical protein
MDEGSGSIAYDGSDYSNDGTLTNGPAWTEGKKGGALQFDGTDDYVDAGRFEDFETTTWTMEAWFKLYSYGSTVQYPTLLWKVSPWTSGVWLYWFQDQTSLRLRFYGVGGVNVTFYTTPLNTWTHVVITLGADKRTVKAYINGELKRTLTADADFIPSTANFKLNGYDNSFDGLIDEVRIYNRALSAEEIRYHYNRGRPVAHWRFDEGSGQIAFDESENNNDGTLGAGTGVLPTQSGSPATRAPPSNSTARTIMLMLGMMQVWILRMKLR